ncbi:MAG: 50S ribosomal protein L4 [Candidatus Brocadia fulgida]|uniref:Large ribosomal subunit protein uL4 n=1 Tax=Candidatus Brocadia fulgida TaxID=380242 RepID=A0A0M2UWP9_9BACT|nr:MAG: 50S ribosomal protein L4 [Candidatus Brocadia fulgida]
MEIPVYNKQGEKIDRIQLDEKKFGAPIRTTLLRDVVIMYEANMRQGTASTKTKAEVAGGGKKPWVQKHTGRARAGSIRSPFGRGGGLRLVQNQEIILIRFPKKRRNLHFTLLWRYGHGITN